MANIANIPTELSVHDSEDNNLFAARYQLYLPNKEELQEQLNQLMDGE